MADSTITLWTGQQRIVLETLKQEEIYHVKWAYLKQKYGAVDWVFLTAYRFFVQEACRHVVKPAGAESPVWLFPDLHWTDVPSGGVLLQVEAPSDQVLLFDLRKWNTILNLSYLPEDEEDRAAFDHELARQGVTNPLDVIRTPYYPQLKARVQNSWHRLFDGTPPRKYTQAALWELRRDWIAEVQESAHG